MEGNLDRERLTGLDRRYGDYRPGFDHLAGDASDCLDA
jgi:hypothetical protein